jgi:hypothetical protein
VSRGFFNFADLSANRASVHIGSHKTDWGSVSWLSF